MQDLTGLSLVELHALGAQATALIRLDAAREYGLVTGGPDVDLKRCEKVVELARRRGVVPTEAEIRSAARDLVTEANRAA